MVRKTGLKISDILFVWILLLVTIVQAETQLSFNHTTVYDQNIFRNYQELPDWVNQSSLYLAQNLTAKNILLRFYYIGNLNLFQTYAERQFHTHTASLESFIPVGTNWKVRIGGNRQWRVNKPDYQIFDQVNWTVYSHLRLEHWESTPLFAGFQIREKSFRHLPEFSFQERLGTLRLKHFFPTRTTFIGEISYGSKKYLNNQTAEEIIITAKDTLDMPGRGRGPGRMKHNTIYDTSVVAYNMTILETRQWQLSLKLAQSVLSKSGISLEYIRQFEPEQSSRYLQGHDYTYSSDDELYDDPYTYSSHQIEFIYTQLLPWQTEMKVFLNMSRKNYTYRLTTVADTAEVIAGDFRADDQFWGGIYFGKNIPINHFAKKLNLFLSIAYLKNQSNDSYYRFSGNSVNGGIEIYF